MSARRAAAVCGVTRFAVRAWIDRGLLPEPPWTAQQLRRVSDAADLVASWPARLVVKERREWWGRVRRADGRQWWIRAVDLRPASGPQP
jgi:hypothetical protein